MPRRLAPLALLFVFVTAGAVPPKPTPGNYILNHYNGTLRIQRDGLDQSHFKIETVGANCHTCDVSGMIQNGVGRSDPADGGEQCRIAFASHGASIEVTPVTEEACRGYCGARASFNGTYSIPPAACTNDAQQAVRDKSLRLYRAHRYAEAANLLRTLTMQCSNFINWIETDRIRNDLALAEFRDGQPAQCLATLNQTVAGNAKDLEDLKSGNGNVFLPPCDYDNYLEVAKSTFFNKALCTKALANQR